MTMPTSSTRHQPPTGTAHCRKNKPASPNENPSKKNLPSTNPCSDDDLRGLEELLTRRWGYRPHSFQLDAITAQLKRTDVVVHAGTGQGKTAIAVGPHLHSSAKGKVTLMVSPLIALHDEMAESIARESGLATTSVNSSNGGCSPDKLAKLVRGDWQVVLISPEQLLSRTFIKLVLKNYEFKQRIMSMVVDEAHVISYWGSGFRKKYNDLGMVCSFLLKSTPIVALSATLSAQVRRDVMRVLRYNKKNVLIVDVGNDRPNVSIVICTMHHPLNSHADLDFIVNTLAKDPSDMPKTFIYCDNIAMGTEIIDHIMKLLPESLKSMPGIIQPYNATFLKEYQQAVMTAFRDGLVRILVCTDAAGMGCNIPDIDVVVQWKLPDSAAIVTVFMHQPWAVVQIRCCIRMGNCPRAWAADASALLASQKQ